jgi:hypothetical protein
MAWYWETVILITYKSTAPNAKKTQPVSIIKNKRQLILPRENIVMYCKVYPRHVSALRVKKADFLQPQHMVCVITTVFKRLVLLKIPATGVDGLSFTVK